jgi:hypothetical protein
MKNLLTNVFRIIKVFGKGAGGEPFYRALAVLEE